MDFPLWRKNDWVTCEAVGESYHANQIRSLFGGRVPEAGNEISTDALLVPEFDNAYDSNAVSVVVGAVRVGHLSRPDAVSYRPVLLQLRAEGRRAIAPCRIWAAESHEVVSYDRRGRPQTESRLHARVTLTLDAPHLCAPANRDPQQSHVLLPSGAAIQLRKEDEHQDAIRPWVRREGESWVTGTLHPVPPDTSRGKELVEIRVDGARIGELTPAMSADYLPTMRTLAEDERATAARVLIKGNEIHAEAVLYAAKSHQLSDAWIQDHLPRRRVGSVTKQSPSRVPVIPAKPIIRWQSPPGWPPPPPEWEPPAGWRPPSDFPPPPDGWQFWSVDQGSV